MSHVFAPASRLSRLLPTAATLLVIDCNETTAIGAPTKLGFTVQPVTSIAHTVIPTISVAVQDGVGNTIGSATNSITLTVTPNPGGASLSGTTTVGAVNGVATFSDIMISSLGIGYRFAATADNLQGALSSAFDVTFGPASKLVFTVQPGVGIPGQTIMPAVTVTVLDVADNVVTTATNNITVAIGTNPGSGTLSGTTTVVPVDGVATFSNLSINNPGVGYTLTAASTNLTSASTGAFTVRNPVFFAVVSAGYFHTCGLSTGHAAYCWGYNDTGQLGLGNPALYASAAPIEVSGGLSFAKIVAGRSHTCAVNAGGIAYCWGLNDGRLGSTSQGDVPGVVYGDRTFAAASAGYNHTCGVTTDGAGYCWGNNSEGELGTGSQSSSPAPAAVLGGLTFASISPGRYFSCGLTGGAAYCWGANYDGELGDGTKLRRTSPVAVSGQYNFASVSAGGFHACGLTTGGLAYCWGSNFTGELGDGTLTDTSIPVAVSGNRTFATISAGNRHTCAVTAAGAAYCWGDNSQGHLGNGTNSRSLVPTAVSGGYTFASVSAGRFNTCGLTTGGKAYCWGGPLLGDGSVTGSLVPVLVQ